MITHLHQNGKGLKKLTILLMAVYTHSVKMDLMKLAFITTITALKAHHGVQVADDIPISVMSTLL